MKILNKFTLLNMLKNKKRTIVTIVGVALSSALLFTVGLFASTLLKNEIRNRELYNGREHVIFKNVSSNYYNLFDDDYEEIVFDNKTEVDDNVYLHKVKLNFVDRFTLSKGVYPKNSSEIIVDQYYAKSRGITIDSILSINNNDYQVVGIYDSSNFVYYLFSGDTIPSSSNLYTTFNNEDIADIYVTFKDKNSIFSSVESIATKLNRLGKVNLKGEMEYEEITINRDLLKLYGVFEDKGVQNLYLLIFIILLGILGIICAFVIYNSFTISVNERKKLLGILRSIGTSKKQIFKSIFFEALVVSIISIPLGLFISVLFISGLLYILNDILKGVRVVPFEFYVDGTFMLLAFLFSLLMTIVSAVGPAIRSSEVEPIEAIRMKQDLKNKKVRANKLIIKLFGIEGYLAYLNFKRNKRKYKTTIISLVIAIILFISGGTLLDTMLYEVDIYQNSIDVPYDISLILPLNDNTDEIKARLKSIKGINKWVESKTILYTTDKNENNYYHDDYKKILNNSEHYYERDFNYIVVRTLDETNYKAYQQKLKIDDEQAIYYNYANIEEDDNKYIGAIYKDGVNFNLCKYNRNLQVLEECYYKIDNIHLVDIPFDEANSNYLLVNNSEFDAIYELAKSHDVLINDLYLQIYMDVSTYQESDEEIKTIIKDYEGMDIRYNNDKINRYQIDMQLKAIRIGIYAFAIFISVIALTSVINTINTSISLRRKEFAVLRSIGLSNKKFNKMIRLESIFFGLKAIIYGIPLSLLIIYILSYLMSLNYNGYNKVIFPTNYIVISIIGTILITFVTMWYATRKIKKDNIIDTIREDNV